MSVAFKPKLAANDPADSATWSLPPKAVTPEEARHAAEDRAIQLELTLLGSMLNHWCARPKEAIKLDSVEFIAPLHAKLYQAIWRMRERGAEPDATFLAPYFREDPELQALGGLEYLRRIEERVPLSGTEADAADAVRAEAAKRELNRVARELAGLALQPQLSAAEALSQLDAELLSLKAGAAHKPTTARDVARRIAGQLTRKPVVYATGIPILDQILLGGFHAGRLYGFAARMGVGKTLSLGTFARTIPGGMVDGRRFGDPVKSLYVCMEMGEEEISHRLLAAQLGENAARFIKRDLPNLSERVNALADSDPDEVPWLDHLQFEDRPGLTLESLMSMLARYAVRGTKVFFVDYWQIIEGQRREETETKFLERAAKRLADFVKDFKVVVVTAAQINREGHTRGGDGLKMSCDMYLHIQECPDKSKSLWMAMEKTRYTMKADVGSEEHPLLYVDNVGPTLRQWGK